MPTAHATPLAAAAEGPTSPSGRYLTSLGMARARLNLLPSSPTADRDGRRHNRHQRHQPRSHHNQGARA